MPKTHTPHLVRRGDGFYFRRAIPLRLRGRFGRTEVRYSLKTQNLRMAKMRCRHFSNLFDKLIVEVEAMPNLDQQNINEALRDYFAQEWAKLRSSLPTAADGEAEVQMQLYGASEAPEVVRGWFRKKSYPPYVRSVAKQVLVSAGIDVEHLPSETMDAVCEGIARAWLELARILEEILNGYPDKAVPQDTLFAGVEDPLVPVTQPPHPIDRSVSTLVGKYVKFKSNGSWTPKTAGENQRVLDWLVGHVGPVITVTHIKKDHIRDFRDLLDKVPANYAQKTGQKGKSLKEIAGAGIAGAKLGYGTKIKYLNALKAFLKWCLDEDYIDKSPADGIKVSGKAVDPKDARHPFSPGQLENLFHSPQYTGHHSAARRSKSGTEIIKDGKYWIPLIALFTGMRLGEIVQLHVSDVRDDDGVSYIDVNKEGGKQLKTASSVRVIPLHRKLIEIGFLEYVQDQKSQSPKGRLFPDMKSNANGDFSKYFSKYFTRYLQQVGVKTPKTTFHSFRHNFEDALFAAHVEDSRRKLLLGHSDKNTTANYGSNPSASLFAVDIAMMNPLVDLAHLIDATKKAG